MMARGQTIRLASDAQRHLAKRLIDVAPQGAVVNIQEARRTSDQNAKLWAMLSDVSRSKPMASRLPPNLRLIFQGSAATMLRLTCLVRIVVPRIPD